MRQGGHIPVVHRTVIAERAEQRNSGEAHAIFRRALDLGLVWVVNFAGEPLLLFLEGPDPPVHL